MLESTKTFLEQHPDYDAVIGIEVHIQLKTQSKIFCSCKNEFGNTPNTNICPICTGLPGVLPTLNGKVVDYALLLGLATKSTLSRSTDFSRKHYMYPDLPKNYQITQDKNPISQEGYISIECADGSEKNIRLVRIHMEEDAGKNIHTNQGYSLVDLNRAGTPLLEIVSYPDISSPQEARDYLHRLRTIVQYLGISDANMEEGSFRADVNISLKKKSETQLGTRAELKNINSFKFIAQAIEYELHRQYEIISSGQRVRQETRQWDSKNQKTIGMRSKEEAQDYRYFTDPDLPKLEIDDLWVSRIRALLPELPCEKIKRFKGQYGLSTYEADNLTESRAIANFFEEVVEHGGNPKLSSNWILRDVLGYLKEQKQSLKDTTVTPQHLADLVKALDNGTINSKVAQDVFIELMQTGKSPAAIIQEKNLIQVEDQAILMPIIERVLAANQESVALYKAGNTRLFMFFVGQAMKETQGKANPKVLQELIKKALTLF
jgi:aspartyl-tRNA(Asn)/glutamyl-tRNA(Gln) amidotransferase subunit B